MIYKLTLQDGRTDYCTAKSEFHLLKSYDEEIGLTLSEVESLEEIPDDQAKTIMVSNTDYDEADPSDRPELSLYELAEGEEFCIVASSEWD